MSSETKFSVGDKVVVSEPSGYMDGVLTITSISPTGARINTSDGRSWNARNGSLVGAGRWQSTSIVQLSPAQMAEHEVRSASRNRARALKKFADEILADKQIGKDALAAQHLADMCHLIKAYKAAKAETEAAKVGNHG